MGLILRAVKGSELTIAEMDGNLTYLAGTLSGSSIQITGSIISDITGSGNFSSSISSTASFGTYLGDGSQLTGIVAGGGGIFAQTGSIQSTTNDLEITGSLTVTSDVSSSGDMYSDDYFGGRIFASGYVNTPLISGATSIGVEVQNNLNVYSIDPLKGNITASGEILATGDISSSADVYGVTGSFLHVSGDGSGLTNVTAEWDGTHVGNAEITGSLKLEQTFGSKLNIGVGSTFSTIITENSTRLVLGANNGAYLTINPSSATITASAAIHPTGLNSHDLGKPTKTWKTIYGATGSFDILSGSPAVVDGIKFDASEPAIRYKTIDIGDWDMDTDLTKAVAHNLSATEYKTIRLIDVMIRDDTGLIMIPLMTSLYNLGTGDSNGGVQTINSTNINLGRKTPGAFDSTDYDATTYNRGWVSFWYTPD